MTEPVTLTEAIKRGEQAIAFVQVRCPRSGELRGLSMIDIAKLEVDALRKLLPRITVPPLTEAEVDNLPPPDLFALATEVAGFLLPQPVTAGSPPQ